jgi:dihydrolipoamide dehydrogenase
VHLIGGPAGEQIYGAAMMIENEMRVKDLFEIVFPHPTISEALKEAVLQAE